MHRRFTGPARSPALAVLLSLALAACGLIAPPAPTPTAAGPRVIRLPMGYLPSVQYAPFYVAAERGYFAEAGLEVHFDYSFETDGVQLVGVGELPFAVVSGEQVLLARAQGLPVVYVMAWFQKFPVAVIARASSGIQAPGDLSGRHIGTPTLDGANFVGLRALLASAGIPPEAVNVEAIGFNQAPALAAGQVDAVVVYANNEPIRLAAQGEELSVIPVGDYVSLAANGLLTSESVIAQEPELARGMVRALLRGLADTIADPEAAYLVCKEYVEALKDDELEKRVLAETIKMWQAQRLGYADPAAWENMQRTMLEAGLLSAPVDLDKAFTNDFLP